MSEIHQLQLSNRSIAWSWSHGPVSRPLVVLHGLGDSSILTYAPRFGSTVLYDTPALFIDLPGFGNAHATDRYSSTIEHMADDVRTLLNVLNIAPTVMFGHSMGGNILISLAYHFPELITSVIVAEPLLDPAHSVMANNIARHSEADYIQRRHQMLIRATQMQTSRGSSVAAAFLPSLLLASPTAMYRAAVSLLAHRDPSMQDQLAAIVRPRHLLVGANTDVDLSTITLQDTKVHLVTNAGHSMFAEQPDQTAYAILGIVSKAV